MRKSRSSNSGFSLTEVLLAVGTIAVGMLFIAGVFPVAIHFTTIASERTIAAVVADEAFAKIRLYGVADFNSWPVPPAIACADFIDVANGVINLDEFSYPSDPNIDIFDKQFYWSALCRRVVDPDPNSRLVQVTVFVSRKVGSGSRYRRRVAPAPLPPPALPPLPDLITVPSPVPVWIYVSQPPILSSDSLLVVDADPADLVNEAAFVNDGYTIVDNQTGQIYRVLERYAGVPPLDQVIKLDRPWQGDPVGAVWVIPPPIGGGREPCIAIYQRVIRF